MIENQFVNSLNWVTSVFFCNVHEKSQWLCLKMNFALVMQWILKQRCYHKRKYYYINFVFRRKTSISSMVLDVNVHNWRPGTTNNVKSHFSEYEAQYKTKL